MNQAFDRWVAKAGKKRARDLIDLLRRSNIVPIIDQWFLVNVGLAMLRDCDKSNVWEASFIAVNMHPTHRVGIEDWLDKIRGFTKAGEKFDDEVVDLSALLPKVWLETPLQKRQSWLKIIKDHEETFDVDLVGALRKQGMTLQICANIFRIYHSEKKIAAGNAVTVFKSKSTRTPSEPVKSSHDQMIYHLFKLPESMGLNMTPTQKLQHAITVRNRTFGSKTGTTISAYLDVEVTPTNQEMLRLKPEDVNMYNVLQQSTCKSDMRHKVAKRTLNALGSTSGMCRLLNGPDQLPQLKANLQFAQAVEEVRAAEKKKREQAAVEKKKDKMAAVERKKKRAAAKLQKTKVAFDGALVKLGLQPGDTVYRRHIKDLTGPQLKAVAFFQCGETLTGNVGDTRRDMQTLLPIDIDDGVPDYPTQDEVFTEPESQTGDSSSSEETTASDVIEFENLYIGDIVEVYWKGENQWYEGSITDVDAVDRQFEVFYKSDSEKLWHKPEDYPVRTTE